MEAGILGLLPAAAEQIAGFVLATTWAALALTYVTALNLYSEIKVENPPCHWLALYSSRLLKNSTPISPEKQRHAMLSEAKHLCISNTIHRSFAR